MLTQFCKIVTGFAHHSGRNAWNYLLHVTCIHDDILEEKCTDISKQDIKPQNKISLGHKHYNNLPFTTGSFPFDWCLWESLSFMNLVIGGFCYIISHNVSSSLLELYRKKRNR